MTDLRHLVQATIRPTRRPEGAMKCELEIATFAGAGALGPRALAYAGVGLDLYGGECLLAAFHTRHTPQGHEHRRAAAITTRRTILGGWSSIKGGLNDVRAWAMHDEVVGLDVKRGLLATTFDVHTTRGPQSFVQLFAEVPEAEAFFRGLLQIPCGYRSDAPFAMPSPSAADPCGAEAALGSLWVDDPRAGTLLRTVGEAAARGAIAVATGVDFVGRITLAHRAACSGPAGHGSSFLSPLSADDFGNVLVGTLGQPMNYGNPQPGMHALDFRYDPQRDTLSPALKALGIAAFVGIGIGFSPGRMIAAEMLRKPPLGAIRVVYGDVPGGCAYEIYGNGRRLELGEAELAHALHQLLVHSALPVLERRVQLGWEPPYAALFA